MGENIVRHLVALCATIICLLAWYAGYVSGGHGWWWTFPAVLVIYGGVHKFVNK